jgi:site-specific recombinase XerD
MSQPPSATRTYATEHPHQKKTRRESLSYKERNNNQSTVRQYSWLIKDLVELCERENANTTSALDGWIIHQWINKPQDEDDVAPATLKTNVKSIKAFIRWCESNELIERGSRTRSTTRSSQTTRRAPTR